MQALGMFYPTFNEKENTYNYKYRPLLFCNLNLLYDCLNKPNARKFAFQLLDALENVEDHSYKNKNFNILYIKEPFLQNDIFLIKQYLKKFKYFYFKNFENTPSENLVISTKDLNNIALKFLFQIALL